MRSARTERTRAFLLRSVNYGEADRIITLLTASRGRVSALARGARRSKKRFGGALQPHALLDVELAKGRGQLDRLASAATVDANVGILASLARIGAAGAGLTWARELGPEQQADPAVFGELATFLAELAAGADPQTRLLAFQARLLALHGLAPELDVCAVSGDPCPPQRAAHFDPARGSIVRRQFAAGGHLLLSGNARERLREALAGPLAEDAAWPDDVGQQVRAVLDAHVLAQYGKDLAGADVVGRRR